MITADKLSLTINNERQAFEKDNKTTENLSQKNNFSFEIDRLFICVKNATKVISVLKQLGLYCPDTIVSSRSQGTRSQIFFFENIYIAIIWLGDESHKLDTTINFPARVNWQQTRTSPFGIGLSRRQDMPQLLMPDYPVDDLEIDNCIAYSGQNQKNALEPLVFMLPDHLKYSMILNHESVQGQKYFSHPLGVKKVTDIKISVQAGKRRNSKIIDWIEHNRLLEIERASEPLIELTFDRGIRGQIFDARPSLPVIFRY